MTPSGVDTLREVLGPEPLRLPRLVADVPCPCARCGAVDVHELLLAADWWDRDAVARQCAQAAGTACPRCGAVVDLPAPMLQLRRLDGVDLLVALPPHSTTEDDQAWVTALVQATTRAGRIGPASGIATIRLSWWPHVDTVPLGPVLAGITALPDGVPDGPVDRGSWILAVREHVDTPDVSHALGRYLTADDEHDTLAAVDDEPALLDPRWRVAVERLGALVLAHQETEEQRHAVIERLGLWRRYAQGGLNPQDDAVAAELQAVAAGANALDPQDPRALPAVLDLVERLRPAGPSRMLARALTSLVPILMAAPTRTDDDDRRLLAAAREAVAVSAQAFGPDHDLTLSAELNLLLVRHRVADGTQAELAGAYASMLTRRDVLGGGRLPDVLVNLATATERRTDLSRGDRQELMLAILEDAAHVAALCRPDDVRTRVFCLINAAVVLRQRVAGVRRHNAEAALARLDEAWRLAAGGVGLFPVERVRLAINRLNAATTAADLGVPGVEAGTLAGRARALVTAAHELPVDNEVAVHALLTAGAVLSELHRLGLRPEPDRPSLRDDALPALAEAADRARRLLPAQHLVRLTALANLGALLAVPSDGSPDQREAAADLFAEVARDAGADDASLPHTATALANLGGLRATQSRWDDAAAAFAEARAVRRRLVERSTTGHTRLGEVIDTGDLAVREAFAHAAARRPADAVAALEDGRATLLRRRTGTGDRPSAVAEAAAAGPTAGARRAVVYVGACSLGVLGVVKLAGRTEFGFVEPPIDALGDQVRALATAPTRMHRIAALRRLTDVARPVTSAVVALLEDQDVDELCVVACGPLAGVPLHAIPSRDGRTWLDRWTVRYWPSAAVAADLRPPTLGRSPGRPVCAVAVASAEADLPLAAAECAALTRLTPDVATPPDGWSVTAWLRGALPDAELAHFACHARSDLIDPTGSAFSFGPDERLTVAELLDGDPVERLQLVVASACQSGVPPAEAPDEFLGIGYGLLHAGAQAVVSTLWEVNDTPAALLVTRFYAELSRGQDPAAALREAQRWLARATCEELSGLCRTDAPDSLPAKLAARVGPMLAASEPADVPFRHPLDWAAFTYLGA